MVNEGFGSYASFEHHLSTLSVDQKNELYLSGRMDRMLDNVENGRVKGFKKITNNEKGDN